MTARAQRIADQIQREIAVLIQLEVSDPRVGMVSVTGVDVSNDLAYAKIYITVLNSLAGDEQINADTLSEPGVLDQLEIEENLKALKKASGFLRTLLAKRLRLRVVPKLQFYYDSSIEQGQRLSDLIDDALAADRELQDD
ncbi:MAG TPA: 30S ribosome-binding factor RbfA [Gammaproteobacteria bacterium]|nr:ribosome-binding factor A [Gammaproteobacteria bacterium]RPG43280.1 MAG: 30S ribosome-binding factor RbfA [Gammaproteobacteria bacterium TMED163]HAO88369.1 30S ribosome-binding factor RbfA [Gammaproteobacteria bacterium]HAR90459.1 30S ribosome-binding factor RbfA [Gammaproteobacteria bacterium]HBQ00282.1 30S ribosome-binding factor RbfA [Gammaproteobacteria bacterium]|tara:strand:+ start:868 stop:1287 length:420 start_codon:yes stop_codon:yes gene_type:complete